MSGLPVTTMASGDVIVFPRGDQHTMRTHGTATTTPITSIFSPGRHDEPPQLSYGGGGRASQFVCGYLNCDQRFSPLVESLPTILVVRSRDEYSTIEAVDASGSRPSAFNRAFKRATGSPPAAWRKEALGGDVATAPAPRSSQ